ncbi:hypothetical protein HDU76_010502 [Blyttiomyces sp. JEL0837]|nr:hypothetical protein HDU76_010502 [Blyttiomyces sp. JEL0837]
MGYKEARLGCVKYVEYYEMLTPQTAIIPIAIRNNHATSTSLEQKSQFKPSWINLAKTVDVGSPSGGTFPVTVPRGDQSGGDEAQDIKTMSMTIPATLTKPSMMSYGFDESQELFVSLPDELGGNSPSMIRRRECEEVEGEGDGDDGGDDDDEGNKVASSGGSSPLILFVDDDIGDWVEDRSGFGGGGFLGREGDYEHMMGFDDDGVGYGSSTGRHVKFGKQGHGGKVKGKKYTGRGSAYYMKRDVR